MVYQVLDAQYPKFPWKIMPLYPNSYPQYAISNLEFRLNQTPSVQWPQQGAATGHNQLPHDHRWKAKRTGA